MKYLLIILQTTLSLLISTNLALADEVIYDKKGKITSETVTIKGCNIESFIKSKTYGGYSFAFSAHLSVLKCEVPENRIYEGKTTVSCNSNGKQIKQIDKDGSEELTSGFEFGIDETDKNGRYFTIKQAEAMAKKLNSLAGQCKSEGYKIKELYPVGTIIQTSKQWQDIDAGYTAKIVAIKKPNEIYDVMILSIHQGNATGLNEGLCTNDKRIEKYKDEGRIFTVPSYCWTKE